MKPSPGPDLGSPSLPTLLIFTKAASSLSPRRKGGCARGWNCPRPKPLEHHALLKVVCDNSIQSVRLPIGRKVACPVRTEVDAYSVVACGVPSDACLVAHSRHGLRVEPRCRFPSRGLLQPRGQDGRG